MGSCAIRPRLRSPNTLFSFRILSLKRCPQGSVSGLFLVPFLEMWTLFCEKNRFRKSIEKQIPPGWKLETNARPGGSQGSRPRTRGFEQETTITDKNNNNLQQQLQKFLLEAALCRNCCSIVCCFCFSLFFLVFVRGCFFKFLFDVRGFKRRGSDTPWAKARRIVAL